MPFFQSLFKGDAFRNKPFITFVSIHNTLAVFLKLNDLRDYKNVIIWVRVPKTPNHPDRYIPLVLELVQDETHFSVFL